MKTERLDILVLQRNLAETRAKAQGLIMSGRVEVNGKIIDKCGQKVDTAAVVIILEKMPFVSRGGLKLDGALEYFKFDVQNTVALDIGASTGGFTDCLLQRKASKVFAVDVGCGQIDASLRNNEKVVIIEKCNARYLNKIVIPEKIDLVTIDVSFISLKKILPALDNIDFSGHVVALVKPQFEAGRKYVKKGVVKNPEVHSAVINEIIEFAVSSGYIFCGVTQSVLKGPKGNVEYFVLLKKEKILS